MTIKFSDGMEFDTSGPLRIESRSDGLYVIGEGMLIPVNSYEEAEEIIKRDKKKVRRVLNQCCWRLRPLAFFIYIPD